MQWRNVRLILAREVRDQLRDRRTLFMIAVLPLLLYPLIGITFLQMAQFLKEYPSRVYFVGVDELPDSPPFINDGKIVPELYFSTFKGGLIELTIDPPQARFAEEARSRQPSAMMPLRNGTSPVLPKRSCH